MNTLEEYLEGFGSPQYQLSEGPYNPIATAWWQTFISKGSSGVGWFPMLACCFPQLCLDQKEGISKSDHYRQSVLRGISSGIMNYIPEQPAALTVGMAEHWVGQVPVISTPSRNDFEFVVRALAFRSEPVKIRSGVHAHALSGLINWGIIRESGPQLRTQLIIQHESPYGSIGADLVPGNLTDDEWIRASSVLRLEHELTHIATKRVYGLARPNLLDELTADAMGMIKALGFFSADLFRECLGVGKDRKINAEARVTEYLCDLSGPDADMALSYCLDRAEELESLLNKQGVTFNEDRELFYWLTSKRLDNPWHE